MKGSSDCRAFVAGRLRAASASDFIGGTVIKPRFLGGAMQGGSLYAFTCVQTHA